MIDLSNNQGGYVDFRALYKHNGQRRVYLKATEGVTFKDHTFPVRRQQAYAAGLKVGAYHFAHPGVTSPIAEAEFFHAMVGRLRPGKDLRPCLDFEYDVPSAPWARDFLKRAEKLFGVRPIIYSYGDFLRRAGFGSPPCALWLASYGRNDGREHSFQIPLPWREIVAHQYTSAGRMHGVAGEVDVSHVFKPRKLDVPRLSLKRVRA